MPLLQFHVFEGRSEQEIATLLDAAHRAVLDTFHVPARDRYQIVHEHKPFRLRVEDTGLNIARSEKFVLVQISTRRHPLEEKTLFYQKLCAELERSCGIKPSDVVVSIVENTDADWSFGFGRAQYLTGELHGSDAKDTKESSRARAAGKGSSA
jgi:hypothetical protein